MGFFRRHRYFVLVAAFLLAAFVLFSVNAGRDYQDTFFGRIALEILGPFQNGLSWIGSSFDNVFSSYFALVNTEDNNKRLTAEVSRLRQQLTDMEEFRLANQRLRDLLALKKYLSFPSVSAELVATDPSGRFRTAIIDKGSTDGLNSNMPVLHSQGVVGRTIMVSPNYSKVLLLIDPNSALDVLVQRSRARGVVEGLGDRLLRLKYVVHSEDVKVGDKLLTSGAAGVFPRGLLVGKVSKVVKEVRGVFLQVTATPAVDFDRLEEVLVILHTRNFQE